MTVIADIGVQVPAVNPCRTAFTGGQQMDVTTRWWGTFDRLFHELAGWFYAVYADSPLPGAVRLAARVAIFMTGFFALDWWVRKVTDLPIRGYFQPVLAVELVGRIARHPLYLAIALLLAAVLIWQRERAFKPWTALEYGRPLGLFTGFVCLVAAWAYGTYDFNLYFNQGHLFDRLLLFGLALLVFWRPVFVLPFVLLLRAIVTQFNYPVAGQYYVWTEVNLLLRALILVAAMGFVYTLVGFRRTADLLFILLSLVAASYFRSGLGKFQLDWLSFPHIYLLMPGGYASGWLSFLSPEAVVTFVRVLRAAVWPMMIFTAVVELGCLFIVARRWTSRWFLVLFPMFHLGVFIVSGIFFWKWIALELALLALLWRIGREEEPAIHTPVHLLLSIVLIAGGATWFKTTTMAWYDTPVQYTYRFIGIDNSGREIPLAYENFVPYTDEFTFGDLAYLSAETQLTGAYGVTGSRPVAEALLDVRSADALERIEAEHAVNPHDPDRAAELEDFMRRVLLNRQERAGNPTWWSLIQAPRHLWSFPRPGEVVLDGSETIRRVIIVQVTTLFDGQSFKKIRERVVHEFDLETPQPAGS